MNEMKGRTMTEPTGDLRLMLLMRVVESPQWRSQAEEVANAPDPYVWIICDLHDGYGRAAATWDHKADMSQDIWFFPVLQREYRNKFPTTFAGRYSFAVISGQVPLIVNMVKLPKIDAEGQGRMNPTLN